MDMKRILQALDGASTKPVEGANDMAKFLAVVAKNSSIKPINEEINNNAVLNEGANPHKVSLPVQMAMQHYQKPQAEKRQRPALIDKYFKQVEDEFIAERTQKRQLINQYASTIAQRVMMKEGKESEWHTSPSGARTNMSPADDDYEINYGADGAAASMDHEDTVTLDIPLLIRLLEYAREDAQTDMDLHNVAEQLIKLGIDGRTLSMDDYDEIMGAEGPPEPVDESKKIKPKKKTSPCWTGYTQLGMQQKDGKTVPKCVKQQHSRKD